MLLLIDAGNTRIKWALVDTNQAPQLGEWAQFGSISHQEFADEATPWSGFVVQRAVVSNVAGSALRTQLAESLQRQNIPVEWLVSQAACAGIKNQYRDPTQLGCDRFATAIAAHALFPDQAFIVATCGTATTIDAVTAEGIFIGGMIAPGLKLMAQSLAQNTAQLPSVLASASMTAHFANYTEAAIVSGCLAAQAGAIELAVRNFSAMPDLNTAMPPLCIVSGGAAKYIIPSLGIPHRSVDNLVLIGLQVIASC
ncbi:type III pantothenate kinase [Solimicrobium silvestre]|uniref:Type III pantothenate kinase n=1 Tax=Solimicrobium silvestre TaxID=2099400 RepID=A0A2S9GSX3_9BURK|nr:type III pantothenate kinase [Solimicrobium silvestre]PRC90805.1 baf: pantothenate kinase, type III [Solimicrobium silvestre]